MSSLALFGYPASLLVGLSLGLTGGGGSILTVPLFFYLFGASAVVSSTYSLLIVGLVALIGAYKARKENEIEINTALLFGTAGMMGVWISRKLLLKLIPESMSLLSLNFTKDSLILVSFSLVMLAAARSMIRKPKTTSNPLNPVHRSSKRSNSESIILGMLIGILAGFVGAGGGFLIVPALVNFKNLSMKVAVGTSLLVIALQSLLGVLGDWKSLDAVDPILFSWVLALSTVGLFIGSHYKKSISPEKLKKGFGYFVLITGVLILLSELGKGNL